jgi:phosphoglycerate dehydrogenase-like enzyme
MPTDQRIQIAILDDFQGVALKMADWSAVQKKADITVFRDHLSDPAAIVQRLKPFEVVCVMRERTPLTRAILEQLPNLKLIASTAARNASIDLAAATEGGCTVCGTGYSANGAAELTWALIMAAARNLPAECASIRKGQWQVSVGENLEGKTIGIVGLGRIGSTIAKYARAFGMSVIAWSQNLTGEAAQQRGAGLVTKEELFREADFVSVHLILSGRTRGIIGAPELKLMKPTAYFVNTSRGPLVDENALIAALKTREIAGAALDVFDVEPLPESHPFRSLDNVIATGHIGFVTQESYTKFYGDTVDNILAWLDGKPLRVMNA